MYKTYPIIYNVFNNIYIYWDIHDLLISIDFLAF